MRKLLWFLIVSSLLVAAPGQAGTAADPEILDATSDSALYTGAVVPHLEITKGWVAPDHEDFVFTMEVANMPEIIQIPKDAIYVFHYTWGPSRFYWRANWSADGSTFDFTGGVYAGCKPPVCASHDVEGNRQYAYLAGNGSLDERLQGEVHPGAPGTITWRYPMSAYSEDRSNLFFKGLFATTYVRGGGGELRYIDNAQSSRDYEHQIYTPWWSKFVPGPSPLLVAVAAMGTLAVIARHQRPRHP